MGVSGKPQQLLQDDFDDYTGYRVMYHAEKFIAGWRNLVLFYLAMFIAGYAQVVDSFLFWGAVTALLLVYWEPYLSPPFPWSSDYSGSEEELNQQTVEKWGSRPSWMHAAPEEEKRAVRQWLFCLRCSLPGRQQLVHRILQSLILVPCVCMGVGVFLQHMYYPLNDQKAMYYSDILFTLMAVYTLLTVGANLVFAWVVKHKLLRGPVAEDWQPQNMMYFVCKILGEFLNTVVQTLVAGSFVAYMPKTIFWLCAIITSMSYTATNLLFDMGPGEPVQDVEVDSHWLTDCACCTSPSEGGCLRRPGTATLSTSNPYALKQAAAQLLMPAKLNVGTGSNDDVVRSLDCAEAACTPVDGNTSFSEGQGKSSVKSAGHADDDSPPFLMYKWPKGVRGWSIIALLIGQAGPCIAILTMLAVGHYKGMPELYLEDTGGACVDKCLKRYQQLLFALTCLGILTCYYAFTIGFLGCGPVTFVYRYMYKGCCKPSAKPKGPSSKHAAALVITAGSNGGSQPSL